MKVDKRKENISLCFSLPHYTYDVLVQCAELTGNTLGEFLAASVFEKIQGIIKNKEQVIKITEKSAPVFFEAFKNPPPPNGKLVEAIKAYKKSFSQANI